MMYSNNKLNFQESTSILNAHTKKNLETYRMYLVDMSKLWWTYLDQYTLCDRWIILINKYDVTKIDK